MLTAPLLRQRQERKMSCYATAHRPEKPRQWLLEKSSSISALGDPFPRAEPQHVTSFRGIVAARQLPRSPGTSNSYQQLMLFSFEKVGEGLNIFVEFNTQKIILIWTPKKHLSLIQCSFETPFDNQRGKTMKDFKFSWILFTGRTIHFIYKWLKITKSKQAEA